jgi:4-hydroxythreonine-4-phosphate dehydrogenase
MIPRIAVTSGEPAGVGPELCLTLAARSLECELVCLADPALLAERARLTGARLALEPYAAHARRDSVRNPQRPGTLLVEPFALRVPSTPGKLDPRNSPYVLELLDRAVDGALAGEFDAVVTAPVHKGAISDAGVAFLGHTEYFAQRAHAHRPVMMLTAGTLRVALATTHLPLKAVSGALSIESLCETAAILARELEQRFGIAQPRIAVCGLNPHAGEDGHLGDEELRIIRPAIEQAQAAGIVVDGPWPADTLFVPGRLADYDAVLAMYHDQGLPVVKHAGFERAVNVTLGLPILRTSPDHGTALDLAGTGRADPGSLIAAVQLARRLAAQRR